MTSGNRSGKSRAEGVYTCDGVSPPSASCGRSSLYWVRKASKALCCARRFASGGCAVAVGDDEIRHTILAEWNERRFAWSPEGAATLAAMPPLHVLDVERRCTKLFANGNHL